MYIITKISRNPKVPYSGPSAIGAGIQSGKIYKDCLDAIGDAFKLLAVNPVGWQVSRQKDGSIIWSTSDGFNKTIDAVLEFVEI